MNSSTANNTSFHMRKEPMSISSITSNQTTRHMPRFLSQSYHHHVKEPQQHQQCNYYYSSSDNLYQKNHLTAIIRSPPTSPEHDHFIHSPPSSPHSFDFSPSSTSSSQYYHREEDDHSNTSPIANNNNSSINNHTLQERRQRNKAASAKYRHKKNMQQHEMRNMINQISERNAMLERQLREVREENQKLRATNDKLRGKFVAKKLLRQWMGRQKQHRLPLPIPTFSNDTQQQQNELPLPLPIGGTDLLEDDESDDDDSLDSLCSVDV